VLISADDHAVEHLPHALRLGLCTLALTLTIGCERGQQTTKRLAEQYSFAWPLPHSDLKTRQWKYRSALEGMKSTKIVLVRLETSRNAVDKLTASLSNRIDLVDMPERPIRKPLFEEMAPWWDLAHHQKYRYFEIDQIKEGVGSGKLQAYLVDTGEKHIVYLCSHQP
jgi:hypothetical protein